MPSKTKSQRTHFRRRAAERYDIDVTNGDVASAIRKIQSGKARFIRRTSLRATVWELPVAGIPCRVVYDNKRKTLITALPISED